MEKIEHMDLNQELNKLSEKDLDRLAKALRIMFLATTPLTKKEKIRVLLSK